MNRRIFFKFIWRISQPDAIVQRFLKFKNSFFILNFENTKLKKDVCYIVEMVKKMSQNEVDKLIDNARLSSSISTDKVARTGLALLEQLFPSEDIDNSDYDAIIEAIINDAKKLCPGLEEQHTFRFALLLLWTLGMYILNMNNGSNGSSILDIS